MHKCTQTLPCPVQTSLHNTMLQMLTDEVPSSACVQAVRHDAVWLSHIFRQSGWVPSQDPHKLLHPSSQPPGVFHEGSPALNRSRHESCFHKSCGGSFRGTFIRLQRGGQWWRGGRHQWEGCKGTLAPGEAWRTCKWWALSCDALSTIRCEAAAVLQGGVHVQDELIRLYC